MLFARGEPDEALRLHHDEVLPVLERLGAVPDVAAVKGWMANVLFACGEPDKALALHAERLEASRQVRDADGLASTLWAIAQVELEKGRSATPCRESRRRTRSCNEWAGPRGLPLSARHGVSCWSHAA